MHTHNSSGDDTPLQFGKNAAVMRGVLAVIQAETPHANALDILQLSGLVLQELFKQLHLQDPVNPQEIAGGSLQDNRAIQRLQSIAASNLTKRNIAIAVLLLSSTAMKYYSGMWGPFVASIILGLIPVRYYTNNTKETNNQLMEIGMNVIDETLRETESVVTQAIVAQQRENISTYEIALGLHRDILLMCGKMLKIQINRISLHLPIKMELLIKHIDTNLLQQVNKRIQQSEQSSHELDLYRYNTVLLQELLNMTGLHHLMLQPSNALFAEDEKICANIRVVLDERAIYNLFFYFFMITLVSFYAFIYLLPVPKEPLWITITLISLGFILHTSLVMQVCAADNNLRQTITEKVSALAEGTMINFKHHTDRLTEFDDSANSILENMVVPLYRRGMVDAERQLKKHSESSLFFQDQKINFSINAATLYKYKK